MGYRKLTIGLCGVAGGGIGRGGRWNGWRWAVGLLAEGMGFVGRTGNIYPPGLS